MTYRVKPVTLVLFNDFHDMITTTLTMVLVLNALKISFTSKPGTPDLIVETAELVYAHIETNDLNVLTSNTLTSKHDNVSLNVILILK